MTKPTYQHETPFGTFDTWEAAAKACLRLDLDPTLCIRSYEYVAKPRLLLSDASMALVGL